MGHDARYSFFYQKYEQTKPGPERIASAPTGKQPDLYTKWFSQLSFEDGVCWGFDVTPADLPVIYWSHTLQEIQGYVRLKLSWWQTRAFQDYQTMGIILNQAFGGGENTGAPKGEPASKEQAIAMIGGMFKK